MNRYNLFISTYLCLRRLYVSNIRKILTKYLHFFVVFKAKRTIDILQNFTRVTMHSAILANCELAISSLICKFIAILHIVPEVFVNLLTMSDKLIVHANFMRDFSVNHLYIRKKLFGPTSIYNCVR